MTPRPRPPIALDVALFAWLGVAIAVGSGYLLELHAHEGRSLSQLAARPPLALFLVPFLTFVWLPAALAVLRQPRAALWLEAARVLAVAVWPALLAVAIARHAGQPLRDLVPATSMGPWAADALSPTLVGASVLSCLVARRLLEGSAQETHQRSPARGSDEGPTGRPRDADADRARG